MTDSSYSSALERVVERWQDGAFTSDLSQIHWMASPIVCGYLNRRSSGMLECDWLTWLLSRFAQDRPSRVLVLGCGDGWLERSIAHHPWIERIDAFDVATGAVERAIAEASRLGIDKIHYGVRDLNVEPLPDGPYDLIIAHSVIHHIEGLEFFFQGLRRALADDGVLFVNEYVGPRRFQFTDRQMKIMNGLFTSLPARYRRGRLGGAVYPRKERPTVEEMIASDPSEAVRSNEILDFLDRDFEVLETIDYGGTILHHLLYDVISNFSAEKPADRAMLELLCMTEEALIVKGGLFADFQIVVAAKKRLAPRTPMRPEPFGDDAPSSPDPLEPLARLARRIIPGPNVTGPAISGSRPAREEQSRQLIGDAAADWVQWILASTGKARLSVLVTGDGWRDLSTRLAADPLVSRVTVGRSSHPTMKHDIVLGLGGRWTGAALESLMTEVDEGGTIAFVSRVSASRPPQWLVDFADRVINLVPPAWRREQSLPTRLRRAFVLGGKQGVSASEVVTTLARAGATVESHPLSSQLTELVLSGCILPGEPADESEDGLLRMLIAVESELLRERLVDPTISLFVARGCRRQ